MGGQFQAVLNWGGVICLVYMATFATIYGVGMELLSLNIPQPNSFFIDLFFIKLTLYPTCLIGQYLISGKVTILPWKPA